MKMESEKLQYSRQEIDKYAQKYKGMAIAMPAYKHMDIPSITSFLVFYSRLWEFGFHPKIFLASNTTVVIARNNLQQEIVKAVEHEDVSDIPVVLWLDSDHVFTFVDFMTVLVDYDKHYKEDDLRVLAARYVTRDNQNPRICAYISKDDAYEAILPSEEGVVSVDGFGFGFVLIDPEVHKKHIEKWGRRSFALLERDNHYGFVSEDIVWCERTKELGYELAVTNKVCIGHFGFIGDDSMFEGKLLL